jgi:hypothetical protein
MKLPGTYHLQFFDPADAEYFVSWEDYATSGFYIKIDEVEKASKVSP